MNFKRHYSAAFKDIYSTEAVVYGDHPVEESTINNITTALIGNKMSDREAKDTVVLLVVLERKSIRGSTIGMEDMERMRSMRDMQDPMRQLATSDRSPSNDYYQMWLGRDSNGYYPPDHKQKEESKLETNKKLLLL